MATWQAIKHTLKQRIDDRQWMPGERIPGEQNLADELGCARATVNRALQSLADEGWLERRRKAGTWIKQNPTRQASFRVAIIREEIEQAGHRYRHQLLSYKLETSAPEWVLQRMSLPTSVRLYQINARHFADDQPYLYEQRWLHTAALPRLPDIPSLPMSLNEWLVQHAPYSSGQLSIAAIDASSAVAKALGIATHTSVLRLRRSTWYDVTPITVVDMYYHPAHELQVML